MFFKVLIELKLKLFNWFDFHRIKHFYYLKIEVFWQILISKLRTTIIFFFNWLIFLSLKCILSGAYFTVFFFTLTTFISNYKRNNFLIWVNTVFVFYPIYCFFKRLSTSDLKNFFVKTLFTPRNLLIPSVLAKLFVVDLPPVNFSNLSFSNSNYRDFAQSDSDNMNDEKIRILLKNNNDRVFLNPFKKKGFNIIILDGPFNLNYEICGCEKTTITIKNSKLFLTWKRKDSLIVFYYLSLTVLFALNLDFNLNNTSFKWKDEKNLMEFYDYFIENCKVPAESFLEIKGFEQSHISDLSFVIVYIISPDYEDSYFFNKEMLRRKTLK
jgi:hypothetical protein